MRTTKPLGVTFGSLGVLGPAAVTDIARLCQATDYQSLWTVEATGTDAMTLLGAAAATAPGLALGTGIIPIQLRSPTLTAMTAATLQALNPEGDIYLGIGVSAPGILGQHGQASATRPLAMMREYVALLRDCLSGERVTFEGDYYQVKRFSLGIRQGERRPRIIMAALNPKMLALAGEIADGVLLNYLPVSHVGPSVEAVRSGGPATIYAYVHACAGSLDARRKSAKRDLFNYAMADGYAAMFSRAGFADEIEVLRERFKAGDREGALDAISDRMIQAIDFIGGAEDIGHFVEDYRDAGVEHPILMPMPWGDDRWDVTVQTMAAARNGRG